MDHEQTGLVGATEIPGLAFREGAVGQMGPAAAVLASSVVRRKEYRVIDHIK